jgi:hypothetical protein
MPDRPRPEPVSPRPLEVCPCCDAYAVLLGGRCWDCQDHEPEEVELEEP